MRSAVKKMRILVLIGDVRDDLERTSQLPLTPIFQDSGPFALYIMFFSPGSNRILVDLFTLEKLSK
jgi:hypothetical protein